MIQLGLKDRILSGPFQPVLSMFSRSKISGVQRSFQKSWYEQFTWLEYSPKSDSAFYFPCRIFKNSSRTMLGIQIQHFPKMVLVIGKWLLKSLNHIRVLNHI